MTAPTLHRVTTLDLACTAFDWPFARARRREIDAHFADQRRAKPALFNGRVLLAHRIAFDGDQFSAAFFETDFASFLAWRDWGFPDPDVFNVSGIGALRGHDGAYVLGEMAAHTANAGRIYFPSGTPDRDDIVGDSVDLAASVAREVLEETGLVAAQYAVDPVWHGVVTGQVVSLIRILDVAMTADDLCAVVAANLEAMTQPEFSALHVARSVRDFRPAMAAYVTAFLSAALPHAVAAG